MRQKSLRNSDLLYISAYKNMLEKEYKTEYGNVHYWISKDTGAPVVWIKGAAHNSNDDQPEIVNEKTDTFIRSIK